MSMPARKKRALTPAAIAAILFALALVGFIAYQTLHLEQTECEVCMSFEGREKCLTVKGASEAEALQTARDNACSFITNGRAEGFRCSQTPPRSVKCRPL
jgi:hypothetical protein